MTLAPTSVRIVEGTARHFGEIDLIARLGHGGMAEVFLASRRAKPAELLVLKRLKADLDDAEHRAMFDDEARVMALLAHPNIVRTVDAGEEAGQKYLAMEFLDGLPLDQCGEAVSQLGERAALHVAAELLEGLHYAHELRDGQGEPLELVHRDISPHNVFITYEGRVTLVDFGIAKSRARGQHTATGVVRGKLSYMAPEQALCDTLDRRADVFAVGVILWELLSGKRYWEGLSDVQILKRMTFGDLPKIREAAPSIRDAVADALDQALAVRPEDRFSSARAFREALADSFDGPFKRMDLGRAVSEAAQGYRAALQTVVERHLVAARNTRGLPGMDSATADLPVSASGAGREAEGLADVAVHAAVNDGATAQAPVESARDGAAGLSPPDDEQAASAQPGERRRTTPDGTSVFETTGGSSLEVPTAAAVSKPSRRTWIVGLVAAGVVFGAVFGPTFAGGLFRPGPVSSATTPVVSSSATAAADSADRIEVKLHVTPSDAVAFLDGIRVAQLPLAVKFPRDQMAHALRVEAPGYAAKSQMLVFDRDLDLAVTLEESGAVQNPAGPPSTSSPSTAAPVTTQGSQPASTGPLPQRTAAPESGNPATAKTATPKGTGFIKGDPWTVPGSPPKKSK